MDWTPITVAAIAAAIPGLLALWSARNKTGFDEQESYYRSIREDVSESFERIDKLQARLDLLEGYVTDLEAYVDELQRLMRAAGLQPPPRPRRPGRPQ